MVTARYRVYAFISGLLAVLAVEVDEYGNDPVLEKGTIIPNDDTPLPGGRSFLLTRFSILYCSWFLISKSLF